MMRFSWVLVAFWPGALAAQSVEVSTLSPEAAAMVPGVEACLATADRLACAGVAIPACLEVSTGGAEVTDVDRFQCVVHEPSLWEAVITAQVEALHAVPTAQQPANLDEHPYDLAAEMVRDYAGALCAAAIYVFPDRREAAMRNRECMRDVYALHATTLAGFLDG